MRIVIDLQGAQTESRFRGIGRYSISLAKAIAKNRGANEVLIVLSGLFPETISALRSSFTGLIPKENFHTWFGPGPTRESMVGSEWRRGAAELIKEKFILSLKPDIVLVSSLFEGFVDDAATNVASLNRFVPVSVILYDLIPLKNPKQYLETNPDYEKFYLRKLGQLAQAPLLLAISEATRCEGLNYLGSAGREITNISTAADEIFQPISINQGQKDILKKKFVLNKSFILYTGGDDERKNLPRLVRAFSQLSLELRAKYQLVFAGKMAEDSIKLLKKEARKAGLGPQDCCFTEYVTDIELVQLYNLCELFVFPSRYEGFGLPVLEAICCGAVVIGADATSIPEVIGNEDALFDPYSEKSITKKITDALTDETLRRQILKQGSQQLKKFSWDQSARKALAALEEMAAKDRDKFRRPAAVQQTRPRLALVSPLPPEPSGIADYSAELLPELARYYEIELVVVQDDISDQFIKANFPLRTVSWFLNNAQSYERILYQFGNSPYHEHMFELLQQFPGVVVLHDFFLSSLQEYREKTGSKPNAWIESLYESHGYNVVKELSLTQDVARIITEYPCNFVVFSSASGVVVHSLYSKHLAEKWYGEKVANELKVIPLLRKPAVQTDRKIARKALGLSENAFIICSFGMLDSTKLNHRLLQVWTNSDLAAETDCQLIFVGQNHGGEYGCRLLAAIEKSGLKKNIKITGRLSDEEYRNYLAAADMAVQLRTSSRGETSAAALDCLNYGLPLIINANGSMAEISSRAAKIIADEFADSELREALESLRANRKIRIEMGICGREIISKQHSPSSCAAQYYSAIEDFYEVKHRAVYELLPKIAKIESENITDSDLINCARSIALTFPQKIAKPRLLLDITATCRNDLKTGIERVANSLVLALLDCESEHFRVEPVYLTQDGGVWHYRYARQYTLDLLGCSREVLADEAVLPQRDDTLLGVDLSGQILVEADSSGVHSEFRNLGIEIYYIVFDLLPVTMPQHFPPGADKAHKLWLETVSQYDGVVCISRDVAKSFADLVLGSKSASAGSFKNCWFHLGADVENSAPTRGLPEDADEVLAQISKCPTFLMVGTIEPRKGHQQVLDAFTELWLEGVAVNLVIVGREGWKNLPAKMRRSIPETVNKMRTHPELKRRFFWLEDCSDEYLEKIYTVSSALVAASEGEGFGLPLIEAAQHKLPIIVRDISVFREVAGEFAIYFSGLKAADLAAAVKDWLELSRANRVPDSSLIPYLTWKESAAQLLKALGIS